VSATLNTYSGDIAKLPFLKDEMETIREELTDAVVEVVGLFRGHWNRRETSWHFSQPDLLDNLPTLVANVENLLARCALQAQRVNCLEERISTLTANAYSLSDELPLPVKTDAFDDSPQEAVRKLSSYAIGCIMGRYSLDKPGLIYAHSGNQGFEPSQYKTFRADDDGIIPLLETDWGVRDDAANRIVEFVGVAWPKEHLEENLKFVADSLGTTSGEQPRDTIRRYLATGFYKHHLSMYKKRPIYWLFSSGKQRAFQCLVYLHRYNESTLGRMRTEYVIPLQGNYTSRIDQVATDIANARSTSHRNKLVKERDKLVKQQAELISFDEQLRHYADQRIAIDLDDGVKVNYGKFGDLLAESKAITGGKDEE
jgi:hypothetical protein